MEHSRQPLFCGDTIVNFHKAETLPFVAIVLDMDTDLRDTKLIASLSSGNIVPIE